MSTKSEKLPEDAVVIAGISGRFPQSDNMREFASNLYNKVDMVGDKENRIKHNFPGQPKRFGLVRNLEKFDAQAFFVPAFVARCVDPQGRILLEHAYEAIYDAGVSPKSLMGSNTGVFVGCFNYDSLEHWMFDKTVKVGMSSVGNSAYALANRLSFALGVNGPSFTLDTACSSSMYALNLAFNAIQSGECDSALVAGTNLILSPFPTEDFSRAGVLAKNGISQPFDKDASGYVRAEACCVAFLQKAKDAKRVYAEIINCKTNNDGFKKEGPMVPSVEVQKKLYESVYKNIEVDPTSISYVEAHATSTQVGDKKEVASIDGFFCKNRAEPLKVGSVKSNIGHAEGAAGMSSIAKSILIFENDKLIPNLNLNTLRDDCPALVEQRIKIVTEIEAFKGDYIGVNSFGVLGANAHVLLKQNLKKKVNGGLPEDYLPRLVLWSGRSDEAVNTIFDDILEKPLDDEYIALLQNSQLEASPASVVRGYGIFAKSETGEMTSCLNRSTNTFKETKRPIAFVYSGVGSQWLRMGKDLMKIPIVADAVEICHNILATKGLNLKEIITSTDPKTFTNTLHTFVGVAAIQIGLTDLLKALNIVPDFIIGHSVGELGCAYADETLSLEEMILSAYSRGMAINEVEREVGAMAAIGMGFKELRNIIPKGIEIACHNSKESCTISGARESIKAFVQEAKEKKLLAKEIESSGIAFHSSFIAASGPILLEKLKEILKTPKQRSTKWISTSAAKEKLDKPESSLSSAEYHTNNLLSPVLFEEGISMLPDNVLMIEIAPHALLQPILKRSVANGIYINLTKKDVEDGVVFLLQALGKIFEQGFDMDIRKIYPPISFPVSRGTSMISPLIRWNHTDNHLVPIYDPFTRCDKRNITIGLQDTKYEFMKGHQIDDRILLPATGYLCLVWETFAMMMGAEQSKTSVCFEEVRFIRATLLSKDQETNLTIMIQRGSGHFEIVDGNITVVDGVIKAAENEKFLKLEKNQKISTDFLCKDDFYKELSLRGYQYSNEFKSVHEAYANNDQGFGKIEWNSNWVSFTDCMLQIVIVANDSRDLYLPTSIRRMVIHPEMHEEILNKNTDNLLEIIVDPNMKTMQCGGVEISGLDASFVNRRRSPYEPLLEKNSFVSHFPTLKLSKFDAAKFCTQLFLENSPSMKLTLIEIDAYDDKEPLCEFFNKALEKIPLIVADIRYLTEKEVELKEITVKNETLSAMGKFDIVIKSSAINDKEFLQIVYEKTDGCGYILSRESEKLEISDLPENFRCIACVTVEGESIFMIHCVKPILVTSTNFIKITTNFEEFKWLQELKEVMTKGLTVVHAKTDENLSGILGLLNCLRKEPNGQNLRCFLIDDSTAPDFDLNHPFYKSQFDLGLAVNVYRDSYWGSYRHLTLSQDSGAKPQTDHCFVNLQNRGDLTSLTWMTGPLDVKNDDVIKVHFAALNFRDILVATRRITLDYEMENRIKRQYICGYEFSGVAKDGRRVMGLAESKAFSTHLSQDELLMIEIPEKWSLEEAATIPLVYITVYTAFFLTTQIEKGKSILIHAGSGGVGLAAIRIALGYDLKVFTTVSTKEKKDYLLEEFPQLQSEHIGNTRDTSFEQMVMTATNGKGVDYVLNSLAEDKMQASIRCLADNGFFLEVGKFDMLMRNKIHLNHFLRGITFKAVLFRVVDMLKNENRARDLFNRMQNDMNSGVIKPLKTSVFDASDVEQAFRFLASGKHIGKVLVKIRENEDSYESLPINVQPRISFDPKHCYVVPGGLGGVGMEFADWMIMRECKKLVLSSSRGISSSYQSYRIKIWKSYGVEVLITTTDISTKSGCEKLIHESMKLGPIGGIFNLAGVLRDAIFENQDETKFLECFRPKVFATKYLDELTRKLCPELEHFVVFSSISCGRGNAGQSNYGMANSITERIVEQRQKNGFPGKAIQWGPIGEVGMLANMQKNKEINGVFGMIPQRISSCMDTLDDLLTCSDPIVSSMVVAEKRKDLKDTKNLIETLMIAMGIPDIKSIKLDVPIAELGMDSLGGAEIQQTLEREFGLVMTFQELKSITLNELQSRINGKKVSEKIQNISSFMDSMWKNLHNGMTFDRTIEEFQVVEDSKQPKLLIIPGMIGGVGHIWSKLQCSVYILQHIQLFSMTRFDEIYQAVEQKVLDLFKNDGNFVLVGYSFGSMIALRLCEKLESLGKSGKLICIDGTPKFMKTNVMASMSENPSDEDIQNSIFSEFTVKTYGAMADEILNNIWQQATWKAKVEEFTKLIVDQKSKEFVTQNLEALFNRIKIIIQEDKTEFTISKNTTVVLIKPSQSTLKIEDDYGMKDYCQHEIRVETIEGDHYTIIENEKIVEIINSC